MNPVHGKYLGEVDVSDQYPMTRTEAVMHFLEMYGGIDGAHHKDWVLDQIARALKGAPVIVKQAAWEDGTTELRRTFGDCPEYENWVSEMKAGEDGPDTYDYDPGVSP